MIGFKRSLLMAGLAALATIAAHPASAQGDAAANYPNRPIRLIVGFAAGGGNDLFARLVGQKLSENIGQPVIIENKPGAGGRIAVEYVKSQPADGYDHGGRERPDGDRGGDLSQIVLPSDPRLPAADHDRVVSADPRRPRQRHDQIR